MELFKVNIKIERGVFVNINYQISFETYKKLTS